MAKDVREYVAENRQRIRNVDSRFVEVDSAQERSLTFGPSTVTVDVDVEVFKRSTGSQILFDHPEDAHGFGMGTFGDDKGEWEEVADAAATARFTRRGRRAVVDALDGDTGAVFEGGAGGDDSTAASGDEELEGEVARSGTFNTKDDYNVVRSHTIFDTVDVVGTVVEFGIYDREGRLLARVTIDEPSIANDEEVKAEVTLTFEGDGVGSSVVTEKGEEAIADSMASPSDIIGLEEFAFGSGDESFEKTDEELTDEEFRKGLDRRRDRDAITARTHVYDIDPSTDPDLDDVQPVDVREMAVFDTESRMIWATTVRSFEKTEEFGFNAESLIRIN